MIDPFLEFLFAILIRIFVYSPGLCMWALTGRSAEDLTGGELLRLCLAFWGAVIMLGLVSWGAVSWYAAVSS